jgi:hypothetical protein
MYIKPGKTFVLSKQTKRMMCSIVDPVARHEFKRAMIQAQLASEVVVKAAPRDRNAQRGSGYNTTSTSATPSAE